MPIRLLLVSFLAIAVTTLPAAAKSKDTIVGKNMDQVTLPDSGGKEHTFPRKEAKLTVVDFWASWCKPCLEGMEGLQAMHDKYKDKGLDIYGLNLGETPKVVQRFQKRRKYDFQLLMGDEETRKAFGDVKSIPRLFLLSPEGEILADHTGLKSTDDLEALIKKHLNAE